MKIGLTTKSKICLTKKHLLYKKYQIESSLENWERYCAVKRRLRKIVDKKKQLHFQTLIAVESKSNNKSFFETFNVPTGKESGSKPNLTVEQCQEFNQFFTSVAEKINKNVRAIGILTKFCKCAAQCIFKMLLTMRLKKL